MDGGGGGSPGRTSQDLRPASHDFRLPLGTWTSVTTESAEKISGWTWPNLRGPILASSSEWEGGAMGRHRAILTTRVDSDERRTHPPPFLINGATRRTLSRSQGCAHLVVREVGRRPTASTSRNRHLIMSPQWEGEGDTSTSFSDSAATRARGRPPLRARAAVCAR